MAELDRKKKPSLRRGVWVGSFAAALLAVSGTLAVLAIEHSLLRGAITAGTAALAALAGGAIGATLVRRAASAPIGELVDAVAREAAGERDLIVQVYPEAAEIAELAGALGEFIESRDAENRELQRSEAELRLLGQMGRVTDREEDLETALRSVCQQVCRFLCWPVGHVWLVDREREVLRSTDIWQLASAELAAELIEDSKGLELSPGVELPGRVYARSESTWVEDAWSSEVFSGSPRSIGSLRSAVAFPAYASGEVIAVIEMFDIAPRPRELRPLSLMHNIGLILGQLVHRRQSHDLLLLRNQELAAAAEAAHGAARAKTAFLANMSHEIRTPMTAILGYADLLASAEPEEREEYCDTIRRNGSHLLQLINDILDVSKIEAGRLEMERIVCRPSELLADMSAAIGPRAAAKGLLFKVVYDGTVPERILTDPTRLHQILLNLVGNAVKFTERGFVRVRCGLATAPDVARPKLRFTVEDSGLGISRDQQGRLFQPFSQADMSTTRRFGGTGLGLSICKSLAELLGGEIIVTSEVGRGSRFAITVETGPLEGVSLISRPDMARRGAPKTEASGPARLDEMRILLAEDGPDNQRLIERILSSAGAKVEIVGNGELALDRALAADSQGVPFDVVLMDMQMPVMDGYEATRRLRASSYRGPIVALTANAMKGDQEKCMRAGCDYFLTKPIHKRKLIQTLARTF